jgi:hypothetical protein
MHAREIDQQICSAIRQRRVVLFEYGDLIRVVEPHRLGVNSAGYAVLSGWLRAGYSRSDIAGGWRTYLLCEMCAVQVLDAPFAGPRPGFSQLDPRMRKIYCELAASTSDVETAVV